MQPTITKTRTWENLSAKRLLININIKKPKCIIISRELKILPIIALSLTLWIMVLEAIIIGDIKRPNVNESIAARKKLG